MITSISAAHDPVTKTLSGLSQVADGYDGFILDLWGVVHDGVDPFPDTIPTLRAFEKAGKKVWLLSNAPRRAHVIAQKLDEMGVTPALYDGLVTSGEASWHALHGALLEQWGRSCYHLGSPLRDGSLYDGLDIGIVDSPEKADFILNTGVDSFSDDLDMYTPVLKAGASKGLPMLCANPDKIVHVKDQLVVCAGALAETYEAMRGQVVYYGKPYPEVYNTCIKGIGSKRVLAVGDGMMTDIAGAAGAGIHSALVTSGIHRDAIAATDGDIQSFLTSYLYRPHYAIDRLVW